MGHVWGRGELCIGFWWGNLKERDHLGGSDVHERIILRLIVGKFERVVETGWS
jgi:hypothetical protein